jgi:cytoskeletal protein CcmA (bactofilin family)
MTGSIKAASEIHAPANDVPMVIGSTASAIGCLALTGTAIVQGYVEGEIRADTVLITTGGTVVGTVVAAEVIVDGAAVDALIFGDRIVLRAGSQVTGEIWHKELILEAGHMFEGKSRRHDTPRSLAPTDPQDPEAELKQVPLDGDV